MDKNKIVILLGLLGFIVMADNWVVSPILPAISDSLAIRVERAGLLITAYMIPFGLFQIVFGPWPTGSVVMLKKMKKMIIVNTHKG